MNARNTDQLLTALQRYTRSELQNLLELFFDQAESSLLQLAQQSNSIQHHARSFETIGLLKRSRATLLSTVLEKISPAPVLHSFVAPPPVVGNRDIDLELVDLQVLDAELALQQMVRHGTQRWSQLLYGVERRYGFLLNQDIDDDNFPLSVTAIGRVLYDGLLDTGIDLEMMPPLIHAAEKVVIPRLGDLYDGINEQLKSSGVLPALEVNQWPELQRFKQRSEHGHGELLRSELSRSEPANAAVADSTPPAIEPDAVHTPLPPETFGAARKLLHLLRESFGARANDIAAAAPVNALLDALAAVRERVTPDTNGSSPDGGSLLQRIQMWLAAQRGGDVVSAAAADQIAFSESVVDELASLLRDTPQLLAVVEQLQIPLAGAALSTPDLFESGAHPAHQLVNSVGELVAASDMKYAPLGQKLLEILDPLTRSVGAQPAVFDAASVELARMSEQQLKARERNIQRLVETCEGQQKLSQAQAVVDRELHRRLAHIALPQLVVDLIQSGWRELLRLAYLRNGEYSSEWTEALSLLEELLWWFDKAAQMPAATRRADAHWLQSLQVFRDRLRHCLDASFPQDYRCAMQVDGIRAALQGEVDIAIADSTFELPLRPLRGSDVLLAELEQAYPELVRWFRRARDFKVGDVFAHFNDPARKIHTLVWVGADQQHFVFVNSRGAKSLDFDLVDLARALADGLYPVEDAANWTVVERAVLNSAQAAYEQIAFASSHDELTGLYNRREFESRLETAVLNVKTRQSLQAVLYVDVDQFALINELHGHVGGDGVLQQLAQRLSLHAGSDVVLARLAGNEFAMLLGENKERAAQIAESLRENIAATPFAVGDEQFELTISIGLIEMNKFTESASRVLHDAAFAADSAKKSGRNRVFVLDSDVETLVRRDQLLAWINKLNVVMESDLLTLRAQPIVPVDNPQHVKHFEILLGLRGEDGSLLPPADFIEAAECYNRMQRVDRWILEHAFQWLSRVIARGAAAPTLSINLSANSLNDATLLDFLIEQFGTYGIPPQLICFELTETATIDNLANAADFMRQAKKLGCAFALDDFGTGRSSYEYLKQLPVDYLKIDGMFIVNLDRDKNDLLMVKSINEIAHTMGIKTIAEFVEREELLDTLREIGVDYAQGYSVGKPRLLETLD